MHISSKRIVNLLHSINVSYIILVNAMKNTIKSINPANEEIIQEYHDWDMEKINPIINDVDTAFNAWRTIDYNARGQYFYTMAKLLRERASDYAVLMSNEMGKPISQAKAEVEKCAWVCEHYAEKTQDYLAKKMVQTESSESFVCFEPIGVVYMIMPWNFPFWQVIRGAAPTIMAGNTIVLKHASNVFGCALAIEQLFIDAGFPENIFRSLITRSYTSSDIIAHQKIRAVTLTGSERAGKQVAAQAGHNLKKSVLELGGSDPYIVLADADLDLAAQSCCASRMLNTGQVCVAAKRFIVVAEVAQEFTQKVIQCMQNYQMSDPLDDATNLGPMAKIRLRDELHEQVLQSIEQGAQLKLGGEIPDQAGAWYPATVLTQVSEKMVAFQEELFGPVAVVVVAENEQEAIRLANNSEFGLGGAIFTQDIEKGRELARHSIDTGTCVVNGFVKSDPRLPFGGIKNSGYGREIGAYGILEFVNIKTVVVNE